MSERNFSRAKEGSLKASRVLDLPIPEEYTHEVEEWRSQCNPKSRKEKLCFEENVRLMLYFGGQVVLTVEEKGERFVVAHGLPGSDELIEAVSKLGDEYKNRLRVEEPLPWEHHSDFQPKLTAKKAS